MSNLLEQASLVLIPSGYKEDVVYSEIPINGAGDMSFTRSSNGTRINSAGLVEVVPWNLVQYSEDFANAFWGVSNGTITSNTTTAPNGTLTADTFTRTSATAYLFNGSFNLTIGEFTQSVYAKANASSSIRLELVTSGFGRGAACIFDLSNGTAGTLTIYGGVSGFTATIESVGNGWYRCSIGGTITIADTYFYELSITSGSVYIWGAQLNIGSTAKPYFPTTDRLNVPRLTYQNGGGGCPSLLLEKQSTNILTYSEDFSNAAWSKLDSGSGSTTPVVTANYAISPDGTQNADRLQCTLGSSGYSLIQQSPTLNGTHTGSVWVKSNTSANQNIYFRISQNTTAYVVTPEWQRINITEVNGDYLTIGLRDQTGYTNYSCDILIWGAQLEASSYPTSYIPTTSSSATRVADACSKTGISSLIGQTEGVMFVDLTITQLNQTGANFYLTDGTNEIGIQMPPAAANNFRAIVYNGGAFPVLIDVPFSTIGRYKIAFAYKLNDFVIYVNGTLSGSDTSGTIPACSQLGIGGPFGNGVNQAILFPTRLTNAELASLTTI